MGDRTYVYYKVHPEDVARLLELAPKLRNIEPSCDYGDAENRYGVYDAMGFDPDGAPDSGLRDIEQCNYGGGEDWDILATAGLRFYGWHGEGCDYGPIEFYSDGSGHCHYRDAGSAGGYVVHPNEDGSVLAAELDGLRAYVRGHTKTKALVDEAWSLLPCNMAREAHGHE